MGKYYCDYCDIYLTHDSMNARKAHNTGRNHIANVRDYFANLGRDGTQNMIDNITSSHEGGGRAQMFAAPSMRLGAGFMNPMATAPQGGSPYPPFQGGNNPGGGGNFPPRPPFPPQSHGGPGQQFGGGAPRFPPNGPNGGAMPPFPPPNLGRGMPRPPPNFTPQQGPPPQGNPGVHPDRMRMMGNH